MHALHKCPIIIIMVCTGSIAAQRMLEAAGYETLAQPHFACFVDDFLWHNHSDKGFISVVFMAIFFCPITEAYLFLSC